MATNNFNLDLGGLVTACLSTGVYLALGLGVFLLIGDFTVFMWANPYLYVYALLWPFILMYHFLKWAIIAVVLIVIVFIGVRLAR